MSTFDITDAKCVLVIGATAGIGRSLALAIHDLPSKPMVIVGGRRQERLSELTKISERIKSVQIDMTSGRDSLKKFATEMVTTYPKLDTVAFSSGIQYVFDFHQPKEIDLDALENELNTNYTSIVTSIVFFLPHFLKRSERGLPSFIIPITSALGIVPAPWVINYSALKAALHSFCLSLESQLNDTKIKVVEILPPLTESELHDHQGSTPTLSKFWMPLTEFTEKTMMALCRGDTQIPVGRAEQAWQQFEKDKLSYVAEGRKTAMLVKK